MASEQDISRLQDAFLAADAAGNTEDAQLFADELRRLAASDQAEPAQVSSGGGDTYASRSLEGLSRIPSLLRDAFNKEQAVKSNVLQGATAGFADELGAKITSAITGNPYESERQAFLKMGEGLSPGLEAASNMVGAGASGAVLSAVAPWTTGYLPGIGVGTLYSMLDAAGRADPGKRIEAATDPAVPIRGAVWSALSPVAVRGMTEGVTRWSDFLSRLKGNPANPYIGRGGANAQEALKESINLSALHGDAPVTTAAPLLAQPAGATAANTVMKYGGEPAAALSGEAKRVMTDKSALQAVGDRYQTDLGLAKMSSATQPSDILNAPSLQSTVFDHLSTYPDVKKILRTMYSDPRFEGVPLDNANARQYVKTMLSETAAALKKSGKKPAIAGRVQHVHDAWAKEMDRTLPGYADVSSAYRDAYQEFAAKSDAAKISGGAAKYIKPSPGATPLSQYAAESASGSVPGIQTRGLFNFAAALAERLGITATKQTMSKISSILTETDPAKIEIAVKMLSKDMTGRRFRPVMTLQGNNAARASGGE